MMGLGGARGRLLAAILWVFLALCLGTAQAAEPTKRVTFSGQAGAGNVRMTDVNARIAAGNAYLTEDGDKKNLDPLHLGFDFTWDLTARVYGPLSLSFGGTYVMGETGVDFLQVIKVRSTATFYHVRASYLLPYRPRPNVKLRLGAAPIYAPSAELRVTHDTRREDSVGFDRKRTATFEAKGWGAHAFIQAEAILNEKVTLVADLGYRWANLAHPGDQVDWSIGEVTDPLADSDRDGIINEWDLNPGSDPTDANPREYLTESFLLVTLADDGRPARDTSGRPIVVPKGPMDLDFSGVLLNVGLRFYLF